MRDLKIRMDVQGNPIADVGPREIDFHATLELRLLDEGFDVQVITGRRDFARQSVLLHFRVVDVVQVDTARPSRPVLRANEYFVSFVFLIVTTDRARGYVALIFNSI